MNERANELKNILEDLFKKQTRISQRKATPASALPEIVGEDRKAFDDVRETVESVLSTNFKPEVRYAVPSDGFSAELRRVLSYRPFWTYESWHVARDITEEALLAAEKDILAGNVPALDALRDHGRMLDYEMPLHTDAHAEYMTILNNIRYLLVVLAHQAKRYASPSSARAFLLAASLIARRLKSIPLCFKESDVDKIIDWLDEGIDELQIASDYDGMEPWSTFAPREGQRLAETLAARDENKEAVKA